MSIEDGIRIGEPVKVTIVGYMTDGFEGWDQGRSLGRVIGLHYGSKGDTFVLCDQPGVTITRAS